MGASPPRADVTSKSGYAAVSPSVEAVALPCTVSFKPDGIYQYSQDEGHRQGALSRRVSLELLNPTHDSDHRISSPMVAVINLVATVCGGGVLSLPLAFKRAGIIPTTILMIYAALTTDFSLYVLISCARRTGGRSYGDVGKTAFGSFAEIAITLLLVVHLCGTLIAYMVLVRDIWTPVLSILLPPFLKDPLLDHTIEFDTDSDDQDEPPVSADGANFILFGILLLGAPLLLKNDLHALRHTCYVGCSSCTLLMIAVVYRAYEAVNDEEQDDRPPLNWYSKDPADLLFAYPIVVLCFLCSYNVLNVHSSLTNPTRERVKGVLDSSMLICFM